MGWGTDWSYGAKKEEEMLQKRYEMKETHWDQALRDIRAQGVDK